MKNLKIQKGQKVTWSEKLCQTCNIVSVTFKLQVGPHTFLYSNYDNRNTNIPYITLQILTYVMFLSVRHFEIFQPDRKAFFKNLPWKKKHHQKHSCLLHGVEVGNITIKKGFVHSSCRALFEYLPLGLLLFKQDSQKQCQI